MYKKNIMILLLIIILILITGCWVHAEPEIPIPNIDINVRAAESPQEVALSLQVLFILTILSIAPSLLIMLTSFTRIVIVLSFTKMHWGPSKCLLIRF